MTVDPSQNTKHFMRLLVEGLNVLGPLNSAISIINSKISPEMKKVVGLVTAKVLASFSSHFYPVLIVVQVLKAHESRSGAESTTTIPDKVPLLVDLTNSIFDKYVLFFYSQTK